MKTLLPILHKLYRIPAKSKNEKQMIQYISTLIEHLSDDIKVEVTNNNIYVTRGEAETYPCIVCHTDQVQENNKHISVLQVDDLLLGFDFTKNDNVFYVIGSAVGPEPYPEMVKFFQKIIGEEAKKQIEKYGYMFNNIEDVINYCKHFNEIRYELPYEIDGIVM